MQISEKAIAVRDELDRYHGRASFDGRDLEGILSIRSVLGANVDLNAEQRRL